jgi:hypothetical protein
MPEDVGKPGRTHLYRSTGRGWAWVATEHKTGRLETATQKFGTYAVMEDDQAPVIQRILPERDGRVASKRPKIRARVSDKGSGIGTITVTCGEQWLLMDYDPEQGMVRWQRDEDLPAGPQELLFEVVDRAGNATRRQRSIIVPEG